MIQDLLKIRFIRIALLLLLSSCSGNVIQTTVFTDGFQELTPGDRPYDDGADPAVCFDARRGRLGEWQVASSLRQEDFDEAWVIRRSDGENYLAQTFTNLNDENSPLSLVTHPMIVTGDSLWSDYTIDVEFTPLAKFDKSGVIFGYHHSSDFYFFGIEGNTVTLKRIQQSVTPMRPIERILDIRPLVWTPGERIHATVTVRRDKVSTVLNDTIRMYTAGLKELSGKIGLISDLPARFHRVEVKLLGGEQRKMSRRWRQLVRRSELHQSDHPKMVRWKRIDTGEMGSNQNLRIGDLTGDGNKEIVLVRPTDTGRGVGSVSVIDLNGDLLWQSGKLVECESCSGLELPVQIHDLDGDGSREVIYVSGGSIHILDGRNGKRVKRMRVPVSWEVKTLMFADLLGVGRDNCILLSDREQHLLVLNEKGEVLWERQLESGCQPLVYDMDQDGRHEVLMGYSVFDPEGQVIFDAGTHIGDRCNGLSISALIDGDIEIPCLVYAAGNWGLLYFDFEGHLLDQNILGHVSHLGVANLDAGSPGLEVITSNRWGSNGLTHVVDARGRVSASFLPEAGVSRCQTVNWKGDGEEFLITSADSLSGGLFDAKGQLSVVFPGDGHPDTYYLISDLTGDARDEIIVWDQSQLWIYTQDDNPRMGNTYAPSRLPLYNYSMHQMNRSIPGW
jgi:rhamnogalacturonan endolyase